jgi:hypothetical protein
MYPHLPRGLAVAPAGFRSAGEQQIKVVGCPLPITTIMAISATKRYGRLF